MISKGILQLYSSYFDQEERRTTYHKWIFNNNVKCNADKMAEAGFIFNGTSQDPDAVSCFFCNKNLDGWEATDDPWKEHLSHSKECDFAKMQTAQENWTLEQWYDLKFKYETGLVQKQCEEMKNNTKKYFKNLRRHYNLS